MKKLINNFLNLFCYKIYNLDFIYDSNLNFINTIKQKKINTVKIKPILTALAIITLIYI